MVFKYYASSLGVFGALMLAGCSGIAQESKKNFSCPVADTSKLLGTPIALQERMQTAEFWEYASRRLCCTNPVWDSSHESSVVAGIHEQTYTPDLQDQELASLQ